jgi:uncharacterized protein YecE (DUF72 family)
MGKVYVGTCSWTDKSLIGTFYPEDVKQQEMLEIYTHFFPTVEVDSTFYRMPSPFLAKSWVKRTAPGFKFHIKAFGPMTGHTNEYEGVKVRKANESMLEEFTEAIEPLAEAGKLGYVLLQFPRWFFPSPENKDYITWLAENMRDFVLAIEFRNGYWFKDEERTKETFDFLAGQGLVYTCVDEPQVDIKSSVPPIVAATTKDMAVLRLHGRKSETWDVPGISVDERFDYDYSKDELKDEIAPRVKMLSDLADEVFVMFNNVHHAYGVTDARNLISILNELETPLEAPKVLQSSFGFE